MADNDSKSLVWLNGKMIPRKEAVINMTEIGTTSVEEVHEGIRGYWNQEREQLYLFRPAEHMKRLANSMKLVDIQLEYSPDTLISASTELVRANQQREDTYIRPMAWPGGGEFFVLDGCSTTNVFIHTLPMGSQLGMLSPMDCCVSSWVRIADNVMPARVKCASNYRNSLLAMKEARKNGYDDAIILNGQGKVAEATVAALFMIRDGVVITPSVTSGILESITRKTLLILFKDVLEMPILERDVDRTELYVADELFCCGTGREIRPIISVDRYPVGGGQVGEVTRQIEALYHDIVRGRDDRYQDWCVPAYS